MATVEAKVALERFFEALGAASGSALALDYDGTLAPFQVDRNAAIPYPGVREALARILATGRTRMVLISGRVAEEVRDLLGIRPAPEIWGVHGRQRLWPNGHSELTPVRASDQQALSAARAWVGKAGYAEQAESKPGSLALHWRGLAENQVQEMRSAIRGALRPIADAAHMSLMEFDGGVELRAAEPNKGTAVSALMKELAPGTPFAFLGDDATDEDAFVALHGTSAPTTSALTVLVRPQWRETAAAVWIRPPEELLAFLDAWAENGGGAR